MKYLVIASYTGFSLDDPEELSNNSWKVGTADTKEEVVELVKKEFNNCIDDEVENRFDLDDEEINAEEIEEFKSNFEISVFSKVESWPEQIEMLEVGELYLNAEFYFEDLKCFVMML